MSENQRLVDIYFDISHGILLDPNTGAPLATSSRPFFIFREVPIVNFHIVDGDIDTPYTDLSSSHSFSASLDTDFDHSTGLFAKTEDTLFNLSGEWKSEDSSTDWTTADPTLGELSFRVDCNNSNYETRIGSSQRLSGWLEVQVRSPVDSSSGGTGNEVLVVVMRVPVYLYNIIDDDGAAPPGLGSSSYYTGYENLSNNVSSATISGLGLGFTPSVVVCTVSRPSSDVRNLFATVRSDSITTDGFTVDLSGSTDSANYKLHYALFA